MIQLKSCSLATVSQPLSQHWELALAFPQSIPFPCLETRFMIVAISVRLYQRKKLSAITGLRTVNSASTYIPVHVLSTLRCDTGKAFENNGKHLVFEAHYNKEGAPRNLIMQHADAKDRPYTLPLLVHRWKLDCLGRYIEFLSTDNDDDDDDDASPHDEPQDLIRFMISLHLRIRDPITSAPR